MLLHISFIKFEQLCRSISDYIIYALSQHVPVLTKPRRLPSRLPVQALSLFHLTLSLVHPEVSAPSSSIVPPKIRSSLCPGAKIHLETKSNAVSNSFPRDHYDVNSM